MNAKNEFFTTFRSLYRNNRHNRDGVKSDRNGQVTQDIFEALKA